MQIGLNMGANNLALQYSYPYEVLAMESWRIDLPRRHGSCGGLTKSAPAKIIDLDASPTAR